MKGGGSKGRERREEGLKGGGEKGLKGGVLKERLKGRGFEGGMF